MKIALSTARRTRARRALLAPFALTLALGAVACAETGGTNEGGGGESVPVGASKEDYIAALADMNETTIVSQIAGAKDSVTAQPQEAYAAMVEEWSGGKIKIDFAYGNSIAPVTEAIAAVGDGRVGFSVLYTLYEPDRYPAHDALSTVGLLAHNSPVVGLLQSTAALSEVSAARPLFSEEIERAGAQLTLPAIAVDIPTLNCTEAKTSLADLRGSQTRVAGSAGAQEMRAMGMSPVSLPFTEVFEGLQRGTVDCALIAPRIGQLGGLMPLAKHLIVAPEVGFAATSIPMGFNQRVWDGLPLAAQQLLHDAARAFLIESAHSAFTGTKAALDTIAEEGGGVHELEPDAQAALASANDALLDEVAAKDNLDGAALVSDTRELMDKWLTVITEDLGIENVSYADFADWYDRDTLDLGPWADMVMSEALNQNRPS
jgi:TRAP-type C4-dicarboxylate transport system substrate-binding protein